MLENLEENSKEKMEKAIVSLGSELKKVRTGKANASMLDTVKVNYYGSPTPLSQVASVSCPDAKSFMIAPWEAAVLKDIEMALVKSDLGMSPINDGKVIRLKVPDVTEERRKELVKTIKKISEEARIAIRMTRREANDISKSALKSKELSEDEQKSITGKVQKLTDSYIKKIDTISDKKEQDILTL